MVCSQSSSSKRTSAKFFSSFQETHHLLLTHQAPRKYIKRHSRVGNKPLFNPQHVQLVQNVKKIQQFPNRSSLNVCRVCRVCRICRVPLARPSTRPWHCRRQLHWHHFFDGAQRKLEHRSPTVIPNQGSMMVHVDVAAQESPRYKSLWAVHVTCGPL